MRIQVILSAGKCLIVNEEVRGCRSIYFFSARTCVRLLRSCLYRIDKDAFRIKLCLDISCSSVLDILTQISKISFPLGRSYISAVFFRYLLCIFPAVFAIHNNRLSIRIIVICQMVTVILGMHDCCLCTIFIVYRIYG